MPLTVLENKVFIQAPTYIDPMFVLYDIETLPFDFTVAVYVAKKKQFIIYINSKCEVPTQKIKDYFVSHFNGMVKSVVILDSPSRWRAMREWLLIGFSKDKLVRAGWNSKHFDIPVMFALLGGLAPDARKLANDIIVDSKRPYQLSYDDSTPIDYQLMKNILGDEHHIDISLLNEKSGDVDGKKRTPAGLKMVSAFAGLEVLDDEITRIDFDEWNETTWSTLDDNLKESINPDGSLTPKGLFMMIIYNAQDVLNTGFLFEEKEYRSSYETKKSLLDKHQVNRTGNLASPSDTSARISSLILTENDRDRFLDKQEVDFMFPMPDGTKIDLLEDLNERKIIPPVLYDFYSKLKHRNAGSHESMDEFLTDADKLLNKWVDDFDNPDGLPVKPAYGADHKSQHTNATLSVPYFDKDLNPIPSYNTFSRGGSHGATSYNATNFSFENARMLKINQKKVKFSEPELVSEETVTFNDNLTDETGKQVVTLSNGKAYTIDNKTYKLDDQFRLVHVKTREVEYVVYDNDIQKRTMDCSAWAIDVGSFYPSFLVLLAVYVLDDGTDVYDQIRLDRLKVKNSLPEDKIDYTEEDWAKNKEQLDAKLILNSVSGASNTMSPYALLKLDNSIMSMRLMGNLFIYMIATYFVREMDAHVLSTNTDGIEITFDHLPESQRPDAKAINTLAERLTKEWGFSLEPERLARFVAKDSNNRIEWHMVETEKGSGIYHRVINKSAGKLNKGFNPDYMKGEPNRINLDSKIDHPMATDMAVLAFIDEHEDYLSPEFKVISPTKTRPMTEEVINWFRDWLKMYASGQYHNLKFNILDWLVFTKGTSKRFFYADGVKLQDNNRYIFGVQSDDTKTITSTLSGKPTKITGWTSNKARVLNTIDSLNQIEPEDIDIEPYALWAYNTLLVWVNVNQTKPDGKNMSAISSLIKQPKKRQPTKSASRTAVKETKETDATLDKVAVSTSEAVSVPETSNEHVSETKTVNTPSQEDDVENVVKDALKDIDTSDTHSALSLYLSGMKS